MKVKGGLITNFTDSPFRREYTFVKEERLISIIILIYPPPPITLSLLVTTKFSFIIKHNQTLLLKLFIGKLYQKPSKNQVVRNIIAVVIYLLYTFYCVKTYLFILKLKSKLIYILVNTVCNFSIICF